MLLALLVGYLLALLGLTLWIRAARGSESDGATFYVARRSLSTFTTACALTATSVGGSSTVLTVAMVRRHGLPGIWMDLCGSLGFLVLGLWLAGRVRQSGAASIAELVGRRYGQGVRRVTALLTAFAELGWLALLGQAAASILGPALPSVGEPWLVAGMLLIVMGYTLLGGQFAVSYTDILQLAIMVVGLLVAAPLFCGLRLGLHGLASLDWTFPVSPTFGWGQVGAFLLLTGLPHLVGSDIYAKLLSARDAAAAARGAVFASGLKALFALAMGFIAVAGGTLAGPGPTPDQTLGAVVHQVLPPGLSTLVLLALLATLMSSADQVLLSAVTMVGHDLRPRVLEGAAWVVPACTVLATGLALLLALAFPSVITLMKLAYTAFAAGLALPVLSSVLPDPPIPRTAVSLAMALGSLVGVGTQLAKLAGVALPADPIVLGVGACALLLLSGRLCDRRTSR